MIRRGFLKVVLATCLLPMATLVRAWNKPAFEAESQKQAEGLLKMTAIEQSSDIELIVADAAENGAVVQIEVISRIPNTESITLLVENNPTPLIARFLLEEDVKGHIVTRIKMADTSNVKAVIKANGRYYYQSKKVRVLEDGCGGSEGDFDFVSSIKMRARLKAGLTEVKAIIVHPMNTGRGKNRAGDVVPAHFIQTINATLNGKPIMQIETSTAIAKNPYLTFYMTHAKVGDKVALQWADNQGRSGQSDIAVK